jgi:hypothetical protein
MAEPENDSFKKWQTSQTENALSTLRRIMFAHDTEHFKDILDKKYAELSLDNQQAIEEEIFNLSDCLNTLSTENIELTEDDIALIQRGKDFEHRLRMWVEGFEGR